MNEQKVHENRTTAKSIFRSGSKLILSLMVVLGLTYLMTQESQAQDGSGLTSIRITNPVESPWKNQSGRIVETAAENIYEPVKTTELNIAAEEISAPPVRLTQGTGAAIPLPEVKPLPNINSLPKAKPLPDINSLPQAKPLPDLSAFPAPVNSAPNAPAVKTPAVKTPNTNGSTPTQAETQESIPLPIPNSAPIQLPAKKDTSKLMPESAPQESFLTPQDVLGPQGDLRTKKEIHLPDGSKTVLTEEDASQNQQIAPNHKNIPAPRQNNPTKMSHDSGLEPRVPGVRPEDSQIINDGNWFGLGRRRDGSMTGNPYATESGNNCEMKGYYPNYSRVIDTYNTPENRPEPPLEAYGTNLECDHPWSVTSGQYCGGRCGWLCGILENMQLDIGVLGFRNTVSNLEQGNFGLDLGLNWSTPNSLIFGLSAQAGGHFVQSSSEGVEVNGESLGDDRSQFFWTSGVFHRGDCWQFGAVYDSLRDNQYDEFTIGQVRVELSQKIFGDLDFGFRGAFAIDDQLINVWQFDKKEMSKDQATAISWYSLFLRKYFEWGGEGMIYGGVTELEDGLVGGQIEVPISDSIALRNSFSFVFSNDNNRWNAIFDQTWNVSATFVFYLNGGARENSNNPLRPLFDVADNGTFIQGYKN